MPDLPSPIQNTLLTCSRHLAQKARLALLTLLILMGVTWGLWMARPSAVAEAGASSTRSGASAALCKHASIAFAPQTTIEQMSQILRAEDAYILYGPDEFSEYHLRFANHAVIPSAMTRMQALPQVHDLIANPHCQ